MAVAVSRVGAGLQSAGGVPGVTGGAGPAITGRIEMALTNITGRAGPLVAAGASATSVAVSTDGSGAVVAVGSLSAAEVATWVAVVSRATDGAADSSEG